MWVSESPTIGIYLNGSYGDLITKDGEYKTFIIFRETKYQLADADTHETLLDLKDWKFTQNQLILIIAPSDIGQIFDESITEIVLDRKDAEETGFFKDPHLICESPDMYLDFRENDIYGVLTSKDHEIMLFKVNIWSKIKDRMGISVSLTKGYFNKYGGFSSEKKSLNLPGTLTAEDGKYIFKIDDSYIGKVFEENITEFELKPAAENQIKDLEQINQQVNADQLSGEKRLNQHLGN